MTPSPFRFTAAAVGAGGPEAFDTVYHWLGVGFQGVNARHPEKWNYLAPMRQYSAKILLFGEHVVLRGGRGLAVPYPAKSLSWARSRTADERLIDYARWLAENAAEHVDAERMLKDVSGGWRLLGDIPTGYGLGSSGAVVAAVYDRYGARSRVQGGVQKEQGAEEFRAVLAHLEGYFHGSSSGTDPYVIYHDRPVFLGGGQPPTLLDLPTDPLRHFELYDTGVERDGSLFIHRFLERYAQDPAPIEKHWRAPSDRAIDALLSDDIPALRKAFHEVAAFQRETFGDFFPAGVPPTALKLCGAGGGGMLLALKPYRHPKASPPPARRPATPGPAGSRGD